MNEIMVTCPQTGKHISTGVITDQDTFDHLPAAISSMNCPYCGVAHPWTASDAWLERESASSFQPSGRAVSV